MEKENIDFVEEKKNGEGTRKRRKIFRKLKYLVHGGEAKKEKEKAGNNWKRKIFFWREEEERKGKRRKNIITKGKLLPTGGRKSKAL